MNHLRIFLVKKYFIQIFLNFPNSELESYRTSLPNFSPFIYRLCVSALHFNENGQRHQATTKDVIARWQISYPKGKKGTQAVVKPNKTAVTFGMFLFACLKDL